MISLAACADRCASSRTLLGDDGKSLAGLTGTRRFDAGIQGEQVRLERDLVDDADNVGDLARRLLDLVHGLDRIRDDLAGMLGALVGLNSDIAGLIDAAERMRHIGGDLVERCGGFLERCGLLLGALGEILGTLADFPRAAVNMPGGERNGLQRVGQLDDGGVEVGTQAFIIRCKTLFELERQIAACQIFEAAGQTGGRLRHFFRPDPVGFCLALALFLGQVAAFLRFLLQPPVGQGIDPEHFHGCRHLADLVGPAGKGDWRGRIATGELLHRCSDGFDRPGNAGKRKPDDTGDHDQAQRHRDRRYGKDPAENLLGLIVGCLGAGDIQVNDLFDARGDLFGDRLHRAIHEGLRFLVAVGARQNQKVLSGFHIVIEFTAHIAEQHSFRIFGNEGFVARGLRFEILALGQDRLFGFALAGRIDRKNVVLVADLDIGKGCIHRFGILHAGQPVLGHFLDIVVDRLKAYQRIDRKSGNDGGKQAQARYQRSLNSGTSHGAFLEILKFQQIAHQSKSFVQGNEERRHPA